MHFLINNDLVELILNRCWRPSLCITGCDNIPSCELGGNVLRPKTTLKFSVRTPPTTDVKIAAQILKETLEHNPPYGAKVIVNLMAKAPGWHAPILAPWLEQALDQASQEFFGKPAAYQGEGGTIPFMGMLGQKFPKAQFLITGVLGPHSNAHGPNEFLHIPTAEKITCCIAQIIAIYSKL
jgi:acetylornithine deacetylase/succinyl-diaminopimelate desuccinylase-like protein